MKEDQMTFRVESELRTSFTEAAELEHRPAAQVLRELMRSYIKQTREHMTGAAANDLISVAERQRRSDAVNFARASVGLEGFKPSIAAQAEARRFVNGATELTDFVKVKAGLKQTPER